MAQPLELSTELEGITLRELTTHEDDIAYYIAYNASRTEIEAFEPEESRGKYQTLDKVTAARLDPTNRNRLRMGIWRGPSLLVGSINLTPVEQGAEIGYWLETGHTGKGYATAATQALANYALTHYPRVIANVVEGNEASAKVLRRAGFVETAGTAGRLVFELTRGENQARQLSEQDQAALDIRKKIMSEYSWAINIVVDPEDDAYKQGESMTQLLQSRYGSNNVLVNELAYDSDQCNFGLVPGRNGIYVKIGAPRLDIEPRA